MKVDSNLCHDLLRDRISPILTFDQECNYPEWKGKLKEKFLELLGIDNIRKNACPLHFEIENEKEKDDYTQIRFTVESEIGSVVPAYILIPDTQKTKYPVAIVLQGHNYPFHNSIDEPKGEDVNDPYWQCGKFAIQAVRHGYIAVAIEQRGMGERRPDKNVRGGAQMCSYEALTALALGRTLLGERVWDVSKIIDALSNFPQCDLDNIFITGHSGGGTASFYAACFDERIKLCAPSCAFSSYKTSILDIFHCACNYIPHSAEWFEMGDLAALIAPRKLLIFAGKRDTIFPIEGIRTAYATAKNIFALENRAENCRFIETEAEHFWCENIVWNEIDAML